MLPAKVSEHLIFWRLPCPVAVRELKCVTLEQTALYSVASITCFHYDLFSQEIIPLHGTIFYRKSVYVLWIYSYYIYIYILPLQRNNKMKCSVNLLLPFTKRRSECVAFRCSEASVCHTHPWHKKFQSSEANCPLSSKKMFNKKTFFKGYFAYFLPCFYQTSDVDIF